MSKKSAEKQSSTVQAKGSRRLLFFLVAFVVALNAAILYRVLRGPEPTYEGKTVSEWCAEINLGTLNQEVVNAFGPSAAPYLVNTMQRNSSAIFRLRQFLLRKTPAKFGIRLPWKRVDPVGSTGTARQWLIHLGTDAKPVVPELIEMLKHSNRQDERYAAASLLGFVGLESEEVLLALIDALDDSAVGVSDQAALSIGRFGDKGKSAIPALVNYLRLHPQKMPFNPILAIGAIGPGASNAVPELIASLKNPPLRQNIFYALPQIGAGAANAVHELVALLDQPQQPEVQLQILETLMQIGPPAAPALPKLFSMQTHELDVIRILASVAVAKIQGDPPKALPVLLKELNAAVSGERGNWSLRIHHPTWPFRISYGVLGPETAAWFLAEIGPDASAALPPLNDYFIRSMSKTQRVIAARAIWRISRSADTVLPILVDALPHGNRDEDVAFHIAVQTLAEMGPAALSAAADLERFVDSKTNRWIARREVLRVLEAIEPGAANRISLTANGR